MLKSLKKYSVLLERIVRMVVGFGSSLVIVQALGLEKFAIISLYLVSFAISNTIIIAGYDALALKRFVKSKKTHLILANIWLVQFSMIPIGLTCGTIVLLLVIQNEFIWYFFAALIFSPLLTLNQLLFSQDRFHVSAFIGIVSLLLVGILRLLGIYFETLTIEFILITYMMEFIFPHIGYVLACRKIAKTVILRMWVLCKTKSIKFIFKMYFNYSIKVTATGVFMIAFTRIDQILVSLLLSRELAGMVALCSRFTDAVLSLAQSVVPIWNKAIFSAQEGYAFHKELAKTIKVILIIALLGYASSWFALYFAITFFGISVPGIIYMFMSVHSLVVPFTLLGIINGILVFNYADHDSLLKRVLSACIIQVCIIFSMIQLLGIFVFPVATVIGYIASSVLFNSFYPNGRIVNRDLLKSIKDFR